MSQIRSKQIRLDTQGDIIIADATASGSVLAKGSDRQILIAGSTTTTYEYLNALRDSTGLTLFEVNDSALAVNTFQVSGGTTGTGPELEAVGTDTNVDLLLTPKGTGDVLVPVGYVPDTDLSLTTKTYVDSVATGLDFKDSVSAATTAASDTSGFTYNNVTDVWTSVVSPTFDTISIVNGDRVLIKDEADQRGNGIWVYDLAGTSFIRAGDADNTPSNEVSGGMFMFVEEGATNADTGWVLSSPNGDAVLGTDNLIFTQFSSAQAIGVLAGDGIIVTPAGSVFTISTDADEATITATGGGGTELAVFNGATNQILIGAGAATDAAWGYQSDLRDSAGLLILDGAEVASAVNNLLVTNAATGNGVSIASAGTDLDIDLIIDAKGTGRIVLDGTQWPDAGVPARSVLVANTVDNLSALTAPDASGNQLLQFNDATNLFEFVASSTLGGDRWADVALTGNTAGDTTIAPNSAAGTLTLNGGAGIQLVGSDIADSVGIDIAINLLSAAGTLDLASDTIAVYDSTPGTHVQASISTIINQGVREAYDDAVATGGANEVFLGFFTNVPVTDATVTVYFNGLTLRESVSAGWTRSGNDLTLVDAVNGYSAEAGDIISADYRF